MGALWHARPVRFGCGLLCLGISAVHAGETTSTNQSGQSPSAHSQQTLPASESSPSQAIELVSGEQSAGARREQVRVLAEGTSSDEALSAAKSQLPLAAMSNANRRRVSHVLENLSMFRAMPTIQLPTDHQAYRFFVEHPDVGVSTWRALGVSECQLWQTGPNSYETEIGDGSFGAIDVLHRGPNDQVVIGEGKFKSPLLTKPIEAVGVLHLQTRFITRAGGASEVICHANLFVAFPSQTIETAAKVISPLTNMVIDRNFREVGLYAHVMSVAMKNRPGWVEHLAGGLDGILESSRQEFLEVTAKVYVAEQRRKNGRGLVRQAGGGS